MAIGSWNNDDCVFALLPKCEANFRTSDSNSGSGTLYNGPASGGTITSTITAAENFGYIYNGGDAYYEFDGNDDKVITDYYPSFTDVSEQTMVLWMKPDSVASSDFIAGTRNTTGNSYFRIYQDPSSLRLSFRQGSSRTVESVNSVLDTTSFNMYSCVKGSGGTLQLYKNGTELSYQTQDTYDLGSFTTVNPFGIGDFEPAANPFDGKITGVIYYNRALTSGDISDLYSLGEDLGGLIGTDNGDGTMDLEGVTTYTLTVVSGTGDGSYASGASVNINADDLTPSKTFNIWTGDTEYVTDVNSSGTTVTMPSGDVTVTATYNDVTTYTLTVVSGTGDGDYVSGSVNEIVADSPAVYKVFDVWTGDTEYVTDPNSSTTDVTMPSGNVTVTATYDDVDYTLTVTSGTGGGSYSGDTVIEITANTDPSGGSFSFWTGDTTYLDDASGSPTNVTMPYQNMSVTANYVYPLTVNNGTGDGNYVSGAVVEIVADTPPSGHTFEQWRGDTEYLDSLTSTTTNVTMPASGITVTATYSLGGWVNTNCVFALIPTAEGYFRTNDASSGYAHVYNGPASGSLVTSTIESTSTPYGFNYNYEDSYYSLNGSNNYIDAAINLGFSNSSEATFLIWLEADSNYNQSIAGVIDGSKELKIFETDTLGQMDFSFDDGVDVDNAKTETPLPTTHIVMIGMVKNGTVPLSVYRYVANVGSMSSVSYGTPPDSYGLGELNFTTDLLIGQGSLNNYTGKVRGFQYYNTALTSGEILDVGKLEYWMNGIGATDNGDGTMDLFAGAVFPYAPSGNNGVVVDDATMAHSPAQHRAIYRSNGIMYVTYSRSGATYYKRADSPAGLGSSIERRIFYDDSTSFISSAKDYIYDSGEDVIYSIESVQVGANFGLWFMKHSFGDSDQLVLEEEHFVQTDAAGTITTINRLPNDNFAVTQCYMAPTLYRMCIAVSNTSTPTQSSDWTKVELIKDPPELPDMRLRNSSVYWKSNTDGFIFFADKEDGATYHTIHYRTLNTTTGFGSSVDTEIDVEVGSFNEYDDIRMSAAVLYNSNLNIIYKDPNTDTLKHLVFNPTTLATSSSTVVTLDSDWTVGNVNLNYTNSTLVCYMSYTDSAESSSVDTHLQAYVYNHVSWEDQSDKLTDEMGDAYASISDITQFEDGDRTEVIYNTYNPSEQANERIRVGTPNLTFPATYTLTVVSGTGDGSYFPGQTPAIVADTPPAGQAFSTWTGDTEYIDNVTESSATVTMPSQDVTVTATYEDLGAVVVDFTGIPLRGDAPLQVAFTPIIRIID